MKDEREILTRQAILKKLVYEAKRSIVSSLLIFFLESLIFGMFYLALSLADESLVIRTIRIIDIILMVLCFTGCAVFIVRSVLNIRKARRGDFTVVEDVLTEIHDNKINIINLIILGVEYILSGYKYHLEHVFKFRSGKTFIANAEAYKNTRLDAAAQFSSPEDIFFLVFYNDRPNKIILLFSSKTYIYKDEK